MHEKYISTYVRVHPMYIYVPTGSTLDRSGMVVDHYLRARQTRVSFMWMKDYSTWNKNTAKKENTLLAM